MQKSNGFVLLIALFLLVSYAPEETIQEITQPDPEPSPNPQPQPEPEPEPEPQPGPPQCDDGMDNDGDGPFDIEDPECNFNDPMEGMIYCPAWNDEANPPQTREQCDRGF